MAKFKAGGKTPTFTPNSTPKAAKTATPKAKTTTQRSGGTRNSKNVKGYAESTEPEDDDEEFAVSPLKGKKRGRPAKSESVDVGVKMGEENVEDKTTKKIKLEDNDGAVSITIDGDEDVEEGAGEEEI